VPIRLVTSGRDGYLRCHRQDQFDLNAAFAQVRACPSSGSASVL
jgi:hypothetical protein